MLRTDGHRARAADREAGHVAGFWEGRHAVVVGGGSGVGQGIALALAEVGVRVLVADIDPQSAAATVALITGAGGRADAATVDGTDPASLAALAATAAEVIGPVHVLVNTVGVVAGTPLAEATEQEWAWFFEFHVLSPIRTVNAFLPGIRAHGEGAHLVVTSSMAGLVALSPAMTQGTNTGIYTVMKHAVLGYGEMLRHELEPEGIRVSVLCPGMVEGNLGLTSGRHRPERFGGPVEAPAGAGGMPPGAMPNDEFGRLVVRALEANRTVVVTHPETRFLVEARAQRLLSDYDFVTGSSSG
ncbi:MAG: SDR family NAD(P)-dependent oxidoreductase [Actinomycetes bacterium]